MGEWDGQSGMGELLPTQILTVEFYNPGLRRCHDIPPSHEKSKMISFLV